MPASPAEWRLSAPATDFLAGGDMRGGFRRWLTGPGAQRRQRRRPRLTGCLLWLVILVIVLVVLSLLFGGFRKGTKVGGTGVPAPVTVGRLSSGPLPGRHLVRIDPQGR